mmetsp:Transcript_749/g.1365  ORF Transcript_749/g.1365 Transcript_749/m.1365 type:complete len:232 (-) Transcript_749:1164-1859(-)
MWSFLCLNHRLQQKSRSQYKQSLWKCMKLRFQYSNLLVCQNRRLHQTQKQLLQSQMNFHCFRCFIRLHRQKSLCQLPLLIHLLYRLIKLCFQYSKLLLQQRFQRLILKMLKSQYFLHLCRTQSSLHLDLYLVVHRARQHSQQHHSLDRVRVNSNQRLKKPTQKQKKFTRMTKSKMLRVIVLHSRRSTFQLRKVRCRLDRVSHHRVRMRCFRRRLRRKQELKVKKKNQRKKI